MKATILCFWLSCILFTMNKKLFLVDCRPVILSIQELLQIVEIIESQNRFVANEVSGEQVVNNGWTEYPIFAEVVSSTTEIANGKIS